MKEKSPSISVNKMALKLVEDAIANKDRLRLGVDKAVGGSTIVDAGIKARGGYEAGLLLTEVCMGGLGKAIMYQGEYDGIYLPTIYVETDYPSEALLASQFAGWRIDKGDYFGMGSGPARAIALKPKEIYKEVEYRDDSDEAVIVIESNKYPTQRALKYISSTCNVNSKDLYVLVAPTSSLAGSIQISGRVAESGLHKLTTLGLDPKKILHAAGSAPIATIFPDDSVAMGRTNDAIFYGGVTFYNANCSGEDLKSIINNAPSSTAKGYGRPFYEIFKSAGFDFYKIDPNLFAPAIITLNNIVDGKTFTAGTLHTTMLKETMGY